MNLLDEPLIDVNAVSLDVLQLVMQKMLMTLLGLDENNCTTSDMSHLQNLIKKDQIFNAFFDLAERIYEYSDDQNIQKKIANQAPLIQILNKNRIAIFKPKPVSFAYPLYLFSARAQHSFILIKPLPPSASTPDAQELTSQACLSQALLNQEALADKLVIEKSAIQKPVIQKIVTQQPLAKNNMHSELQSVQLDERRQLTYHFIEFSDKPHHMLILLNNNDGFALNNDADSSLIAPLSVSDSITNSIPDSKSSINPKVTKMPYFQIPNARVGLPYEAQIKVQGSDSQIVQLKAESVVLDEELGIRYDAERDTFYGTPAISGEYPIKFEYLENNNWLAGHCTFIITADPRSLWQVNEPDAELLYPKPHTAHQLIKTDSYSIAAASRRGRSHEHAGSFRDDDFFIQSIEDTGWSILAVADGAGSANYSREGSNIAVQTSGKIIGEHIAQNAELFEQYLQEWQQDSAAQPEKSASQALYNSFYEVFSRAAMSSIEEIEKAAKHLGVSAKTFATTLLIAVVKRCGNKTFVCTFWVGDGAIAVYSPDMMRLMGTPDGGEFAGQTRFLDKAINAQFDKRVSIGFFENVQAIILMSDGISDPKFETDSGLLNQQKWNQLWDEISPCLQDEQADSRLLEWMHFFSAGHHDDRTLALQWLHENNSIGND